MKKWFLLFAFLIWGQLVFAQLQRYLIKEVTEVILKEEVPQVLKGKIITLTASQAERLAHAYPMYKSVFIAGNDVSYSYYGLEVYNRNTNLEVDAKLKAAAKLWDELHSKNSGEGDFHVRDIQVLLKKLGYDIVINGRWGDQTKKDVDHVLGLDSKGISKLKIKELLVTKVIKRQIQERQVYVLSRTIDGVAQKDVELTPSKLNDELSGYKCGLEEICAKVKDKNGGSIEYACQDAAGHQVKIRISTEKSSIELNVKSPDGGSSKMALSSDGKITLTSSDGNSFKGASINTLHQQ
ncbi:MAG: hypothetical protein J7577_00580 [Sphingobacteriaceae bacterium]|nr:hypothetical protein [Sphingobacteriaceae bacterium]